jgi:TPR repeat protein
MPMILHVAPMVTGADCRGFGRGWSPRCRFRRTFSRGHGRMARTHGWVLGGAFSTPLAPAVRWARKIARYPTVNQRIALVVSGVLALALFGAVVAGPLEDGEVAYRSGDYAAAMNYWRALADQGNARAQYDIGLMYELGQGAPQDYEQALYWYLRAGKQGNASAQYELGDMYARGLGVPRDQTQAVAWYSKAADQGHPVAQYNLGVIFERGQGVPQDYARAHMWFNLAASYSPNQAFPFRGLAVRARDEVAAKMTPAQIDEAQRLTSEWTPK